MRSIWRVWAKALGEKAQENEDAEQSSTVKNKAEQFAEEIKSELKTKEPSGLMKKETE